MATVRVSLEKQEADYHFRATNEQGHTVDVDDSSSYEDGVGNGVGPMQLLVIAIGSCSGVDIVSILQKGRQQIDRFRMEVVGEKPDGVAPSLYEHIHVRYDLGGDIDPEKARRAIELSLGKYCSVARMLEKSARISYGYSVNGEVFEGAELPAPK